MGPKVPFLTPPISFFFSRNFFHKRIWFYFLFLAKNLCFPHCVRCFGAHFPGLCEKLCEVKTLRLSLILFKWVWLECEREKGKRSRQTSDRPRWVSNSPVWLSDLPDSPMQTHDIAIAVCQKDLSLGARTHTNACAHAQIQNSLFPLCCSLLSGLLWWVFPGMNTRVSGLMTPKSTHEQTKWKARDGSGGSGGGVWNGFEEVLQGWECASVCVCVG